MIYGKDVSVWNTYIPGNEDFVMVKIGGGDNGLYYDTKASYNYGVAKQAGKVVGRYWFLGSGESITNQVNFYIKGMQPFAEGDLYALDFEVNLPNPVVACKEFLDSVYAQTGVRPFIYMDISRVNAYDWSSVFAEYGLWLAAPSIPYADNAPIKYIYVMQQGPVIMGIDQDVFFGTREQLLAYGYHAPVVAPAPVRPSTPEPAQVPTPVVQPQAVQTTTPTPNPVQTAPVQPTEQSTAPVTPPATDSKQTMVPPQNSFVAQKSKSSKVGLSSSLSNSGSWWTRLVKWILSWLKGV